MAKEDEVFGGLSGEDIFTEESEAEKKFKKRASKGFDLVGLLLFLGGVILFAMGIFRMWKSHSLSAEIQSTQSEISRLAYVEKKLKELKKKEAQVRLMLEKIAALKQNRTTTINFFEDMKDLIPPGVLISKISKNKTTVRIQGYAPEPDVYSLLLERLNESGYFVSKIEETKNKNGSFEIVGILSLKEVAK